jgi:hypothetical protein
MLPYSPLLHFRYSLSYIPFCAKDGFWSDGEVLWHRTLNRSRLLETSAPEIREESCGCLLLSCFHWVQTWSMDKQSCIFCMKSVWHHAFICKTVTSCVDQTPSLKLLQNAVEFWLYNIHFVLFGCCFNLLELWNCTGYLCFSEKS